MWNVIFKYEKLSGQSEEIKDRENVNMIFHCFKRPREIEQQTCVY